MGGEKKKWNGEQRGDKRGGRASTLCWFQCFANIFWYGAQGQARENLVPKGPDPSFPQKTSPGSHHGNSCSNILEEPGMKLLLLPALTHRITHWWTFSRSGNWTEMSVETKILFMIAMEHCQIAHQASCCWAVPEQGVLYTCKDKRVFQKRPGGWCLLSLCINSMHTQWQMM